MSDLKGQHHPSAVTWITGKMSKLKAKDKIYFDFNKTFDIDLCVMTHKEKVV